MYIISFPAIAAMGCAFLGVTTAISIIRQVKNFRHGCYHTYLRLFALPLQGPSLAVERMSVADSFTARSNQSGLPCLCHLRVRGSQSSRLATCRVLGDSLQIASNLIRQ